MKKIAQIFVIMISLNSIGQEILTPETLLKLGRVTALGITKDEKNIVYKVTQASIGENKMNSKLYTIPISGGNPTEIKETLSILNNKNISPDGKYMLYSEEVKIDKIHGKDYYPELDKSNVQIYNSLDYRHWDTWNEGKFNHVFYKNINKESTGIDIMWGKF